VAHIHAWRIGFFYQTELFFTEPWQKGSFKFASVYQLVRFGKKSMRLLYVSKQSKNNIFGCQTFGSVVFPDNV
jgi:hypothetical protein